MMRVCRLEPSLVAAMPGITLDLPKPWSVTPRRHLIQVFPWSSTSATDLAQLMHVSTLLCFSFGAVLVR